MVIRTYRIAVTAVMLFSFFILAGCAPERAKTEKQITDFDPSFKKELDAARGQREELSGQEMLLRKIEGEADNQISILKKKKAAARKDYLTLAERAKHRFDPLKKDLKQHLTEVEREYKTKKDELRFVERGMKEINLLIKKKDKLTLSQEELRTWNERLGALGEKKSGIISALADYKKGIDITRMKIKAVEI